MQQGGLRTSKLNTKTPEKLPLLSIVTVVRNCEQFLEQTILNIIGQNLENVEYIIIDGNSTDRTLDIIRKYDDKISYWISEPDNGIYDAMNKGISLANGEWLNFMNAGDEFNNSEVVEKVVAQISNKDADIVYGDVIALNPIYNTEILVRARSVRDIWKGMIFSHQACFIKTEILRNNLFDTRYQLASDYNQILSLYLDHSSFFYIPIIVSKVRIGGLSYSNSRTLMEEAMIVHSRRPYSIKQLYFVLPFIINLVRVVLGKDITNHIRKKKWKHLSKKNN
jgi:glycosyltransferase involved in cell wall biosynthesis